MTFRDNNEDHHGETKVDNDNREINEVNHDNNNREHKNAASTSDDGNNIDTNNDNKDEGLGDRYEASTKPLSDSV